MAEPQKAALGLGLCSAYDLLTSDDRKQLNEDLLAMAIQRRNAEASSRFIVLS